MVRADTDLIDLRDVVASIRRGRRLVVASTLGGLLLGVAATLMLEKRFEASTTVLLRESTGMSSSPLGRLSELGGFAGIIGGSGESGMETELQILRSRSLLGAVIDSLGLQLRVLEPNDVPPGEVVRLVSAEPDLGEGKYVIRERDAGYQLIGPGVRRDVAPGSEVEVQGARLLIGGGARLPERVEFELVDRRDALERMAKRLEVSKSGGEVAELEYRGENPWVAAAVPNALVARYFDRRQTTDRGVNQTRYEFLLARSDSLQRELATAESELRRLQERSGVGDPEFFGQTQLGRALEIQGELEALETEARTLREVLAESRDGRLPVRALAAFPTFLRNAAINNLLSQLLEIEAERTQLLQRRTPRDPEVVALTETVDQLEAQLVSLSSAYLHGVERQGEQIRTDLEQYRGVLASLPAHAEASYRKQREVRLLAQMMTALQAELLEARLGAIAEGGEVRVIDPAVPPEDPAFPRPLLNAAIGLFGGLMVGMLGALATGYLTGTIREPREVAGAVGLHAVEYRSDGPLLIAGLEEPSSVMVLPVGSGARTRPVARRIAETAALRGERVVLVDWTVDAPALTSGSESGAPAHDGDSGSTAVATKGDHYRVHERGRDDLHTADARAELEQLERSGGLVISVMPALEQPISIALLGRGRIAVLVAASGELRTAELQGVVAALDQLGVPLAAVVLHNGDADAAGTSAA